MEFIDDDNDVKDNPLDGFFWLQGDSLAPPCQADVEVVNAILGLSGINEDSIIFDLGCGDGRICIQATSKFGCLSLGCEIEQREIDKFRRYRELLSPDLQAKVTVVHGDLLELDLSAATAITIYLLPEAVELLKPRLIACLRRGCTIIFNTWGIKGLNPVERVSCGYCNNTTLLKYTSSSIPDNYSDS